jgi:signal transduction histidine kinase
MLLNLIFNAADALQDHGKIHLETRLAKQIQGPLVLNSAPAAEYILIEVKDEGCGISEDILPRIFEPFFTTKAFSSRRGTGLGLSMVYELAKQLKYGLKVESQVGKGSKFTIIIPVTGVSEVASMAKR